LNFVVYRVIAKNLQRQLLADTTVMICLKQSKAAIYLLLGSKTELS